MKYLKFFLLTRFLAIHKGFSIYKNYSIPKKNYYLRILYFFKNFTLNKYFIINSLIDISSEFFFFIINIIFFPLTIYLKIKGLKIAIIDTLSIGDFYIDLSLIINDKKFKSNNKKNYIISTKRISCL